MLTVNEKIKSTNKSNKKASLICYHCGTACANDHISLEEKLFCCEGCKLVYEILNNNGLCDYYKLQSHPGLSQIKPLRSDKYAYLDNEQICEKLYKFSDGKHAIVTLYIPGVHCSSCMWLLEHMHRLTPGITESRLNFSTKELTIHFSTPEISLRKIVELLTTIGYEPHISLQDGKEEVFSKTGKRKIYKLGVAGFCFGNIMMMSFPEYFSSEGIDHQYVLLFRALNLILSVPVFFYCGSEFFTSAWKGLQQRMLNIDAPIVLALLITYSRSLYEIFTNTGSGYLDSMSGIVFFMLVGRVVQERAYRSVSFHRDYEAYFPIAVNIITTNGVVGKSLRDLKEGDMVQLYNGEIIPADGIVIKGNAQIDYSFVTGESEPVAVPQEQRVYAGGRQIGEQIIMRVAKPVAGSYLTSLWNHHAFSKNKIKENDDNSILHVLSRYFTYILFSLAIITAVYWAINDPSKILPSVSAMLIVACPCALLLAATYTNGNLLRLLSVNGLFLRDASVIEQIGKIDHIVFDKTGTLTQGNSVQYSGPELSEQEKNLLYSAVLSSRHPYSQAIVEFLGTCKQIPLESWQELPGQGIDAHIEGHQVKVGSKAFTEVQDPTAKSGIVYAKIDEKLFEFSIIPAVREGVPQTLTHLQKKYGTSLLSGDNDHQKTLFTPYFSNERELLFQQKPIDKLNYIEALQQNQKKVLMIGDGLNDAGALQQSNVGITLADDINNFTPSCDAILDAGKFVNMSALLRLATSGRTIIKISFIISVLYNIVGLFIAVQGLMNPMIAAILMPLSTLTIVLLTTGMSSLFARFYRLSLS